MHRAPTPIEIRQSSPPQSLSAIRISINHPQLPPYLHIHLHLYLSDHLFYSLLVASCLLHAPKKWRWTNYLFVFPSLLLTETFSCCSEVYGSCRTSCESVSHKPPNISSARIRCNSFCVDHHIVVELEYQRLDLTLRVPISWKAVYGPFCTYLRVFIWFWVFLWEHAAAWIISIWIFDLVAARKPFGNALPSSRRGHSNRDNIKICSPITKSHTDLCTRV